MAEWAVVNYVEREFNKSNYITFRNEYRDDMKGPRTGCRTKYYEDFWDTVTGSELPCYSDPSFVTSTHSMCLRIRAARRRHSMFLPLTSAFFFESVTSENLGHVTIRHKTHGAIPPAGGHRSVR